MAAHEGTYFDKEQMEALAQSVKCLITNVDQQWENVENVFKACEADDIIADDSMFKEPITESIQFAREAYTAVTSKLAQINGRLEGLAEEYHIAIMANIKKSQEAVALIKKQAAKAKEATGANA